MAVVFYKLLFGLHPFSVSGKDEYKNLDTLADKIQAGLFPFGQKSKQIEVIPPPHQNFEILSKELKNLFIQTLDKYLFESDLRPEAEKWKKALLGKELQFNHYKSPVVYQIKTEDIFSDIRCFHLDKPVKDFSNTYLDKLFGFVSYGIGFYLSTYFVDIIPLSTPLGVTSGITGLTVLFLTRYLFSSYIVKDINVDLTNKTLNVKRRWFLGFHTTRKFSLHNITVPKSNNLGRVFSFKYYGNIFNAEHTIIKVYPNDKNVWQLNELVKLFNQLNIPFEEEESK